jgi:hypothetical protein
MATHASLLKGLDDADPRLGLFLPDGDKLWVFSGKTQSDAQRTLTQLVADGPAAPPRPQPLPLAWQGLDPKLRISLTNVAEQWGAWQLIAGLGGDRTGPLPDVHGQKDAVGLRAAGERVSGWLWQGKVPTDNPRLHITIGTDDGTAWQWQAHVNGKKVHAEELPADKNKERWIDRQIPLSDFAGQDALIVVTATSLDGTEKLIYWKTPAITP